MLLASNRPPIWQVMAAVGAIALGQGGAYAVSDATWNGGRPAALIIASNPAKDRLLNYGMLPFTTLPGTIATQWANRNVDYDFQVIPIGYEFAALGSPKRPRLPRRGRTGTCKPDRDRYINNKDIDLSIPDHRFEALNLKIIDS